MIDLPAGTYAYVWYDARDEATLGSGEVSGGGTASIPAPAPTWGDVTGTALLLTSGASCGIGGCDLDRDETCLSCAEDCGSCDGAGCRGVSESTVATLTCPAGQQIATIDFASYGTPKGACSTFTVGACHATSTVSVIQSKCLGQPTCSLEAANGLFGDPCAGVSKRLYVQYSCAAVGAPVVTKHPSEVTDVPTSGVQGSRDLADRPQLVGGCSAGPGSPP